MTHGMEHWHPDPEFFFKPGGGPVLDIGPYYLTALVNLIGPVRRVMAMASAAYAERVVTAKLTEEGRPHRGRDPHQRLGAARVRERGAVDRHHDLGRLEARASSDRNLRHRGLAARSGSEFLRRRGGDHREGRRLEEVRQLRHALRQAELALAELGPRCAVARQLPGPRRGGVDQFRAHGGSAPGQREPCPARTGGHVRHPPVERNQPPGDPPRRLPPPGDTLRRRGSHVHVRTAGADTCNRPALICGMFSH